MSFAAFVSGVMQPTVDRYKAEQETKRRLEEHASAAKLDKALNEWEFYSPDERAAAAPELDKLLKQKKGYSADLLGKGGQAYDFLKGALAQQKPIESLEAGARKSAALPVSIPRRMSGPETTGAIEEGRDFEVGPSIQSTTPIALPSEPVSLPPLPIEGADIPRVDSNVLQLPASQRALAAKDYQTRQKDMLSRQSKVGEIGTSPLGAEDKEVAIESLYLPPGVLSARERAQAIRDRGAAGPNRDIGLGVTEFVSPDGTQRIYAQATRGGGFMDSRTGKLLDPEALNGWTKVFNQSLFITPNQQGSVDVLNRQRLGQQMNQTGTLAGTVPDVRPAETKTPLVDQATGNIAGDIGSRSGFPGMRGRGTPMPTGPIDESLPPPQPLELGKSPRSTTEQNARVYLNSGLRSLKKVQEIAKRRPDLIGLYDYSVAAGKRMLGMQKDKDANDLINALKRFTEDAIRIKEGAVVPEAMYSRLEGIISSKGWSNEEQFQNDLNNAIETLNLARQQRGLGALPLEDGSGGNTAAPPPPSKGSSDFSAQAPNEKTYHFPTQAALDAWKAKFGIK